MHPFTYTKAIDNQGAIAAAAKNADSKFIGGGTNLVDLMKMNIETPSQLVDICGLPLKNIETLQDGTVRIGALVRNNDLAYHPVITAKFPMLSKAILSGASAQLRNLATTGGNILQRTRCYYFYDTAMPCNKRQPGSGCSAITGYNRNHAILGTSDYCIATHPSDMCVAMAALGALINVQAPGGDRTIPFSEFFLLPRDTPQKEHALQHGELITSIDIPPLAYASNSTYVKTRDRASYEFALASAAVALSIENGTIRAARVALGGVGTIPWRAQNVEQILVGKQATLDSFQDAAEVAVAGSKTFKYNAFKNALVKKTIMRALQITGGLA